MTQDDLFHDKPAEQGRDPFWVLVVLFSLIVVSCFVVELVVRREQLEEWLGKNSTYYSSIARLSGDLALSSLLILMIWFGRNRMVVFGWVLVLGMLTWIENELLSRATFDGFIGYHWWELEAIDSCSAVIFATGSMPVIRWLTKSKQVFIRSISVSDIMLLTLAVGLLITATRTVAEVTGGWSFQPMLHGWDVAIEQLIAGCLRSLVGLSVVYVSCFGRLIWGCGVYLVAWINFFAMTNLVEISQGKPTIHPGNLNLTSVWHGDYDSFVPVFLLFLLCILLARLFSRMFVKTPPNPIDLGAN